MIIPIKNRAFHSGYILAFFLFAFVLNGCSDVKIEKNPQPIVWGQIIFKPETIETGKKQTVWNNVTLFGYGHSGSIGKVTVTEKETVVENLSTDFYSAKKLIFKGVSGDYKQALEFFMSDKYIDFYNQKNFQALPKFKIDSYESVDEEWKNRQGAGRSSGTKVKDLSFTNFADWTTSNLVLLPNGEGEITVSQVSAKRIFLPDNLDTDPEKVILKNFEVKDINVKQYFSTLKRLYFDYENENAQIAIDDIKIPGLLLKQFNLPKIPEFIEGSAKGDATVKQDEGMLQAQIDLKNLFDLSFDLKGNVQTQEPEEVNFVLKDTGINDYISNEMKGQLAILGMFIPNAQEAVIGFLSKPGQTISGSLIFSTGAPQLKFELK